MSVRNFSLLSVVIFVLACPGAFMTKIVPVAPIAIVALLALTGLAFQLEDAKLQRKFAEFMDALHGHDTHHAHGSQGHGQH